MELSDYRKSHLSDEKGEAYHAIFYENPYRRMVWELEKNILNYILIRFLCNQKINHLDFACGTGRILQFFSRHANTSVGVDLSPSMLAVARSNNKNAEIIEADITRNDVLGERKFNLITAFRFFPNAQPELRKEAMRAITRHLATNGYILFNNHINNGSFKYRLSKLLGRAKLKGMSTIEVNDLLKDNNLEVVKTYHLCVLPFSERRLFVPRILLQQLEKLMSHIPMFHELAENHVYLCKIKNCVRKSSALKIIIKTKINKVQIENGHKAT